MRKVFRQETWVWAVQVYTVQGGWVGYIEEAYGLRGLGHGEERAEGCIKGLGLVCRGLRVSKDAERV